MESFKSDMLKQPIRFNAKPEVDGQFNPNKLLQPIRFDVDSEVDGQFNPNKLFTTHPI